MSGTTIAESLGDSMIDFAAQCVSLRKFIKKRTGVEMTEAKVQRYALICFGAFVGFCISPTAALCIGSSIAGAYYWIKDYEDVKEIESMRKKALNSDFFAIIKEHHALVPHGSLLPIVEAGILTQAELKGKIEEAMERTKHDRVVQDLLRQYKEQVTPKSVFFKYIGGLFS